MDKQFITIFGGSEMGNRPEFERDTKKLAEALLNYDNLVFIYGSGNGGIMSIIPQIMSENGKEVIGIIPEDLEKTWGTKQLNNVKIIRCTDLAQRKKMMLLGDKEKNIPKTNGVICLPGGLGTQDELYEAISLQALGQISPKAPIALLDTESIFMMDFMAMKNKITQGFITKPEIIDNLILTDDPEELAFELLKRLAV